MRSLQLILFSVLLLALSATAFADIKIKSKQTMSGAGQAFENTTYIKGRRQRTETMSGMMVNITQCDLKRAIQMNPAAKTFTVDEFGNIESTATTTNVKTTAPTKKGGRVVTTINVRDTGERKQMFGMQARRLIITMDTNSTPDSCSKTNSKMETDGWYVDFDANFDCDQTYNTRKYVQPTKGGCQDAFEMKQTGTGKRGYPLYEKMTMFDESGAVSMSMTTEVLELSKATLEQSLFEVPSDYRQVSDASQLFSVASLSSAMASDSSSASTARPSTMNTSSPSTSVASSVTGPKKAGTVRIGLAYVKTGSVGDGVNSQDLALAVQNSFVSYLKTPNVEVVTIDAKLASAIESEVTAKECDLVVYLTVSHKKGGGGFGKMLGSAIGNTVARTGIGNTGSTAGNIAGQVATQTIVSAATVSSQMKAKDELSLDLTINRGGVKNQAKQFKVKAASDGEDIITKIVEQAAEFTASTINR